MKKIDTITIGLFIIWGCIHAFMPVSAGAQETQENSVEELDIYDHTIFNDKLLIEGYIQKYSDEPLDILVAMIRDDRLAAIKMTAAIEVFRTKHVEEVFSREKKIILKYLLRRLARTESPYTEIAAMHTLCAMYRYKYFKAFVPKLLLKLDHYNSTVNEMAFTSLNDIIGQRNDKSREARIVFNTLRKTLFLSRKRLKEVVEPDEKLARKLKLLRWSIKILGSQELKRLPKEVLNLL